jgi:MYXO-CTERM domain-containing protein
VVGVIVVAAATGTADDLPWGAIIGVLVVMALAYAAGRRRIPPREDD